MAMCAGVQKLSRPMERCQETSHAPPITAEVTAMIPHQTYQGTAAVRHCDPVMEADAAGTPIECNESTFDDIGTSASQIHYPVLLIGSARRALIPRKPRLISCRGGID